MGQRNARRRHFHFAVKCTSLRHKSFVLDRVVEVARLRRGGDVCAFNQNRHFW